MPTPSARGWLRRQYRYFYKTLCLYLPPFEQLIEKEQARKLSWKREIRMKNLSGPECK